MSQNESEAQRMLRAQREWQAANRQGAKSKSPKTAIIVSGVLGVGLLLGFIGFAGAGFPPAEKNLEPDPIVEKLADDMLYDKDNKIWENLPPEAYGVIRGKFGQLASDGHADGVLHLTRSLCKPRTKIDTQQYYSACMIAGEIANHLSDSGDHRATLDNAYRAVAYTSYVVANDAQANGQRELKAAEAFVQKAESQGADQEGIILARGDIADVRARIAKRENAGKEVFAALLRGLFASSSQGGGDNSGSESDSNEYWEEQARRNRESNCNSAEWASAAGDDDTASTIGILNGC